MDEIQVVAFLASRKEIVVHLSQSAGNFVGLDEVVIEEAADPGVLGGRKTLLEQQGGYRIEAGVVKAVHASRPTVGIGEHASILQSLVCPLQAVAYDIVPSLHYNATPSRSTLWWKGMAL